MWYKVFYFDLILYIQANNFNLLWLADSLANSEKKFRFFGKRKREKAYKVSHNMYVFPWNFLCSTLVLSLQEWLKQCTIPNIAWLDLYDARAFQSFLRDIS